MYNIGIVGFGVVGKSILSFLNEKKGQAVNHDDHDIMRVSVWDARALSNEEQTFIKDYGAAAYDASTMGLEEFLKTNDYIIASPGVDLNNYQQYNNKFLCELDFFSTFFTKPVVAVTGSFGKTTTTKLLGMLTSQVSYLANTEKKTLHLETAFSQKGTISSAIGGNIGIGMLDLVKQQDAYDLGVLELSSFQLEINKKFAPDIAVLTNVYANHLDRHKTLEAYFEAKYNLICYQRPEQAAVISLDVLLGDAALLLQNYLPETKSQVCFVASQLPDVSILKKINKLDFYLFYVQNNQLLKSRIINGVLGQSERIFDLLVLPNITFLSNWLQIITTLYILGADLAALEHYFKTHGLSFVLDDHHHRVEYFATVNGVDFYNDSKSTVIQTTQAAVDKLIANGKPLIVIVGGLGKGVDRSPLMKYLESAKNIKKIYSFGKQDPAFSDTIYFSTLEEVVADIAKIMQPGDQVLLSPSGASFDLFKNYEHRGQVFKELVLHLKD